MSSLAERLDSIHLRVRVPGTEIEAELRNRRDVTLSFGPSVYEWLNESHLEHFLAHLARLLYVAWIREYRAALSDEFLEALGPESQRDRDYLAARDLLASTGTSADGRVTISAVGLQNFTVRLAPGSLRELSEQEFVACTGEAVGSFIDDQMAKINELKMRFFT